MFIVELPFISQTSSSHSSGARIRVRACALGVLHGTGRNGLRGNMVFSKHSEALLWCWKTLPAFPFGSFVPLRSEVVANYPFSSPLRTLLPYRKNLTSLFTEKLKAGSFQLNIHAL